MSYQSYLDAKLDKRTFSDITLDNFFRSRYYEKYHLQWFIDHKPNPNGGYQGQYNWMVSKFNYHERPHLSEIWEIPDAQYPWRRPEDDDLIGGAAEAEPHCKVLKNEVSGIYTLRIIELTIDPHYMFSSGEGYATRIELGCDVLSYRELSYREK